MAARGPWSSRRRMPRRPRSGSQKSTSPMPRTAAQPSRAAAAWARTERRLGRAWELVAGHEHVQGEEPKVMGASRSAPEAARPGFTGSCRRGWPAIARAGQWHAPGVAPSRAWELHDEQARMKNELPPCARAYLEERDGRSLPGRGSRGAGKPKSKCATSFLQAASRTFMQRLGETSPGRHACSAARCYERSVPARTEIWSRPCQGAS